VYLLIRPIFICFVLVKKQKVKAKKAGSNELKAIGERLKQLRKDRGFSNADFFAYENGIAAAQYARYERGEDMRVSTLIRLAKAYDVSLSEFFKDMGT
jgi:hypothetical protein